MPTTDAIRTDGAGPYLVRDPRSRISVRVDWSEWLTLEGTAIASSSWESDAGVTLDTPASTTTAATVYVSGGTDGETYTIRNTITCANGVIDSRSIRVMVRDR